ncbi:hypothetical protein HAPAU_41760 [Halalkalicoccus paucihalophilus]|uniref:Uncharacterized protein n=1 Tax=Halalkalicoccus paucihalophilus TaxID=1008153 RepID=A0A151A7Y2_9EURY|nr:hypothetical protein HAPAU_41760 [Halalkalicoccus paucihalophilus]
MRIERLDRFTLDPFDARPKLFELRVDLLTPGFQLPLLVELFFEILDILCEGIALARKPIAFEFELCDLLLGREELFVVVGGFNGRLQVLDLLYKLLPLCFEFSNSISPISKF